MIDKQYDNKLNKIVFEFSTKFDYFNIMLGSLTSHDYSTYTITKNIENIAKYKSYSIQKLARHNFKCNPMLNNNIMFSDYQIEYNRYNCVIESMIQKYNCLLREIPLKYFVNFYEYLEKKMYKICDKDVNASTLANIKRFAFETLEYCNAKFSIECNSIHLETVFEFYKSNSTKLYLIPINSKHIRYFETFKSDINELIYNLGGIIGLWFGLSSISLINLIVFLFNDISKLFHKCKQFILSIKLIFIYLLSKTKYILLNLLISLFYYFKN